MEAKLTEARERVTHGKNVALESAMMKVLMTDYKEKTDLKKKDLTNLSTQMVTMRVDFKDDTPHHFIQKEREAVKLARQEMDVRVGAGRDRTAGGRDRPGLRGRGVKLTGAGPGAPGLTCLCCGALAATVG